MMIALQEPADWPPAGPLSNPGSVNAGSATRTGVAVDEQQPRRRLSGAELGAGRAGAPDRAADGQLALPLPGSVRGQDGFSRRDRRAGGMDPRPRPARGSPALS